MIHETAVVHPGTELIDCDIGPFCVIGSDHGPLSLQGATVRSHTIIEGGSYYEPGLETGHHVLLRSGNEAGANLRIGSYSSLEGGAMVGDYVRIHGRCEATNVVMHDFARVFLNCSLTDDRCPPTHGRAAPVIGEGAVVCANTVVLAGVTVGLGAYVAASSVVNKDVPPARVWGRGGLTWSSVQALSWGEYRHPWTNHFRDTYPPEAQDRLADLHARIMGACREPIPA